MPKSRPIESSNGDSSLTNVAVTERYDDKDSVESVEGDFDRNDNHYARKRTN